MNKKIARFVSGAARQLGYEIIPTWSIHSFGLTRLLAGIIARNGISCVLDVGANTGQYAGYLRRIVGFDGRIVSFEPIDVNVAQLHTLSRHDPLWTICDCALGRHNGTASLNVMKRTEFSSFLAPTYDHLREFRTANVVERVETVSVRRLDDVLEELQIDPAQQPVYLKMDTQGFDLEVVAGAPAALRSVKALQTEVSVVPLYENTPDMLESIATLRAAGFAPAGFFPVTTRKDLSAIEFDAVFINRTLASSGVPGAP